MSSSATAAPPNWAYSPAPASGASSFMPSFAVIRSPLKSPSRRASTPPATSADSAASVSAEAVPYRTSTTKRIQTRSAESTRRSVASSAAIAALTPTSSGLRGSRSTIAPSGGPASTGSHIAKTASAARPSEPVSDFTQTPAASHMADVQNPETTTTVRNSPAVRSRSTRTVADPGLFRAPRPRLRPRVRPRPRT